MKQAKSVQSYWYGTVVVVAVVFGLIGAIGNADSSSAPQATTTTNAGTVVLKPMQATTTTEVPLQFDAGDFIDEQRNLHGKCGEWFETAMATGWQPDEWENLSRIMFRESRCKPDACSKSTAGLKCRDAGLMQVNQIHTKFLAQLGFSFPDSMLDATLNLSFARRLYEGSGWKPWTPRT